jgi:hypothetical protein
MALITVSGYTGPPVDGLLVNNGTQLDTLGTPIKHRLISGGEVRFIAYYTQAPVGGTTTVNPGYITAVQAQFQIDSTIANPIVGKWIIRRGTSLPPSATYIGEPFFLEGFGLYEATDLVGGWIAYSKSTASTYRHNQTTAANTWTVNHNLGRDVEVTIFTAGGQQMWAEYIQINSNQVIVYFDGAYDGYALVQ